MNTGIQILIERMKTNPEEFLSPLHDGRAMWGNIVSTYWEFLSKEDQAAYQQARDAMIQDEFTEVVMKKLAGVGDDDGVALGSVTPTPSMGALRINRNTKQYEVWDGSQWIETNQSQQALQNQMQNSYQQLRGMGLAQGGLRVSTQSNDSNSLYSVPSLQKASAEGNLLSQIAKRMGRK
jgi:hypothetical protein